MFTFFYRLFNSLRGLGPVYAQSSTIGFSTPLAAMQWRRQWLLAPVTLLGALAMALLAWWGWSSAYASKVAIVAMIIATVVFFLPVTIQIPRGESRLWFWMGWGTSAALAIGLAFFATAGGDGLELDTSRALMFSALLTGVLTHALLQAGFFNWDSHLARETVSVRCAIGCLGLATLGPWFGLCVVGPMVASDQASWLEMMAGGMPYTEEYGMPSATRMWVALLLGLGVAVASGEAAYVLITSRTAGTRRHGGMGGKTFQFSIEQHSLLTMGTSIHAVVEAFEQAFRKHGLNNEWNALLQAVRTVLSATPAHLPAYDKHQKVLGDDDLLKGVAVKASYEATITGQPVAAAQVTGAVEWLLGNPAGVTDAVYGELVELFGQIDSVHPSLLNVTLGLLFERWQPVLDRDAKAAFDQISAGLRAGGAPALDENIQIVLEMSRRSGQASPDQLIVSWPNALVLTFTRWVGVQYNGRLMELLEQLDRLVDDKPVNTEIWQKAQRAYRTANQELNAAAKQQKLRMELAPHLLEVGENLADISDGALAARLIALSLYGETRLDSMRWQAPQ